MQHVDRAETLANTGAVGGASYAALLAYLILVDIAAKADGIATTSPDPGSLVEIAKEANEAKIPIINFNSPDPTASFNTYVGGDNVAFGKGWAQYLACNHPCR